MKLGHPHAASLLGRIIFPSLSESNQSGGPDLDAVVQKFRSFAKKNSDLGATAVILTLSGMRCGKDGSQCLQNWRLQFLEPKISAFPMPKFVLEFIFEPGLGVDRDPIETLNRHSLDGIRTGANRR